MLAASSYPQQYIDECRSNVRAQLSAYEALGLSAGANGALASFEPQLFNNLLLALEMRFVHRTRNLEGKDGNALNETRLICESLLLHDGRMTPAKAIKMNPEDSVLGIGWGEQVALSAEDFRRLSEAFLEEIEAKYR